MIKIKLPDMVNKVSSLVEDQSVTHYKNEKILTISTKIWNFNYKFNDFLGTYIYESTTIVNRKNAEKNEVLYKKIERELINMYSIIVV
jgi:hypothetical protein